MRIYVHWTLGLALIALLMLSGCNDTASNEPSPAAGDGAVLSVPTRTLGPIVSFTPRFTATPIPSATYTPSLTPTVTDTPVPPSPTPTVTPTPTPTMSGVIRSTENVNLRSGPGTNYEIVLSVRPGTELGVLGMQTDSRGREWYKVAYTDEDGEVQYLWVLGALIETDFASLRNLVETPPATSIAAATPEPNRVDILAYCQQKRVRPPSPKTTDEVYIEWSWYVARPEYMEEHLLNANYEVRLDGRLLENYERYATEMKREEGVWIIYWYYPVGKLSAGQHEVDFRLTWDQPITDGYARFGPGTPNEVDRGSCTFTVTAP
jgi:uncharacterized protein YraI